MLFEAESPPMPYKRQLWSLSTLWYVKHSQALTQVYLVFPKGSPPHLKSLELSHWFLPFKLSIKVQCYKNLEIRVAWKFFSCAPSLQYRSLEVKCFNFIGIRLLWQASHSYSDIISDLLWDLPFLACLHMSYAWNSFTVMPPFLWDNYFQASGY
jgi:hypothetical protein